MFYVYIYIFFFLTQLTYIDSDMIYTRFILHVEITNKQRLIRSEF